MYTQGLQAILKINMRVGVFVSELVRVSLFAYVFNAFLSSEKYFATKYAVSFAHLFKFILSYLKLSETKG